VSETAQINSVSCPECGASTVGLTPLFHHPFCPRLFKASGDAETIAKLQAENAALRAVLREYMSWRTTVEISIDGMGLRDRARALLEGK
jgi:hypothetical protein